MSVEEAAEQIIAQGESAPWPGRDPVNPAMVNTWLEALGDNNTRYAEQGVAPVAMAQVWTMRGLNGVRDENDPMGLILEALDDAGYTSVVATNSEQTYRRELRHGERIAVTTKLEDVAGPKKTALGEGYFVTTKQTWYVGAEVVADMLWRILKFRPRAVEPVEPAAPVLRPVISRDTEFFWEGTKLGELRIQRWGDVLRHPPGPMPPDGDLDAKPDWVVASGRGTVYSYVVHHRPAVPGKHLPFVIALVELTEGVRMLGEVLDVSTVEIGQSVEAAFVRIDDDLTLPAWRVVS